jgi:hypothetical protein
VPTITVREQLEAARFEFFKDSRKDGKPKVETGQITLWLRPLRSQKNDCHHDFAQKWEKEGYLDGWAALGG